MTAVTEKEDESDESVDIQNLRHWTGFGYGFRVRFR